MKKTTSTKSPELDPALYDATADSALACLAQAGAGAATLVEEWIRRSNAAAVSEVAERGQGGLRKAARRGLNVLKARGIALPERRRVTSLGGSKAEEIKEAFMLAPDALGNLVLIFTSHAPASRYKSAFVVLNDEQGIHRVDVAELSQSQLKDAIDRLLPGAPYKPVKVLPEWARWRVARARKQHAESGTPEPLGFASAAALLEPVPAEVQNHPFDSEGLELADDDARELAKKSAALHNLPEFRGWFPPRPAVDELLAKLGETLSPGEQPPAERMRELMDEQIRAATDRWFSPQRRELLVRMLKDSALSVLQREGEVRALEVVATISVVQKAGLITDPPHEVPFLRGFFEKAVGALLAQSGGNLRVPVPHRPVAESAPESAEPSPEAEDQPDEAPDATSPAVE